MSFSQFDPSYPVPEGILAPGVSFTITGPFSIDPDRKDDLATISILVQILQTPTQTVATGSNVIQGVGLTRWSCPVTIQSGGFQPSSAKGIATVVEQYSDPDESYTWTFSQKLKFV